jgi:16S rRNA (guanine527-N7)-methyltransferase
MASPDLKVTLIEANRKKAAFLSEVTRALNLANVSIVRQRFVDVEAGVSRFDFITARALGQHEHLLGWAASSIVESGEFVLWLAKDDAQEIMRTVRWSWRDPIQIPMSLKRVLLVGSPENRSHNVPRGTRAAS